MKIIKGLDLPARLLQANHDYQKHNKDKVNAYQRLRHSRNKDKMNAYQRAYRRKRNLLLLQQLPDSK